MQAAPAEVETKNEDKGTCFGAIPQRSDLRR
jgi:hypothetical protein